MLRPIRRALLSVSDKTGLVDFARELVTKYGVELIATGGTRTALAAAGLPVRDIAELTGFPEILDGRVKTLHPAIYAGLLAKRDKPEHMNTLAEHGLPEIDLVVCNLYPFEETVAKLDVTEEKAVESIDIGGPCMIRAAAKNYAATVSIHFWSQYAALLHELSQHAGNTTLDFRRTFACAAFEAMAYYDLAIRQFLEQWPTFADDQTFPRNSDLNFTRIQHLRYGENPHQKAAFYLGPNCNPSPLVSATLQQLHGKELSYNNILDLDSALNLAREFDRPAAVVVKHNNPCGAAVAATLADAFALAWDGDPQSAFGGILAFNRPLDPATAAALMSGERFVECVIAPDYDPAALAALKGWKKNVRLLKTGPLAGPPQGLDYRRVDGGLLVQTRDTGADDFATWETKTKRAPTADELAALQFAWLVCKHVKSNAIVLASRAPSGAGCCVVGVGAGQMSRVDSVQVAVRKAGDRVKGSVLASDAFFPFRDNVDAAAAAGVAAIAQPGGSQRDADSVAACDEHGLAMVFTGVRHFRH
ncbi:MAG: bifunctional phosphoribosylaminoimidazolecarboxamide formyltransferase/IMP cyclohydrolase [Gemmataceae bacterium]|nr:bifunctional phosphoribosylaminoimidazolecarboxamide formyltransferase/IMP cyclohydrolase [Gemmataceae bacterium]